MFEPAVFACPYSQCRKTFRKPLMLTDSSKIPRETYYACPYCLSKINMITDDPEDVQKTSVKVSETNGLAGIIECPHHFGYLKKLGKNASIPDECLSCFRLMECFGSGE